MKFEKILGIATMLGFAGMAIFLVFDVFLTGLPQPITIQQYRGGVAVGIMIGILAVFSFQLGAVFWKDIKFHERLAALSVNPHEINYKVSIGVSRAYKKAFEELKAKTGSKTAIEVIQEALSVYAQMLEEQPRNPVIRRVLADRKKPSKPSIVLVVDNTHKDEV